MAHVVEVSQVSKSFAGVQAIRDLSFTVEAGELFGLVGPNGAGKTTTMRILLGILQPDAGVAQVLGGPVREEIKSRLGYLPEERGLYRKLRVRECLTYLGALKGLSGREAQQRMQPLLERVGLWGWRERKIEELSRGMGQLIQLVATIVHEPALVILDEPFSGLDPVNMRLVKDLVREMGKRGQTVILSTHMMNDVEELCDRLLMIDRGQEVLYGQVAEIKDRFRDNAVVFDGDGIPDGLPGAVRRVNRDDGSIELFLEPGADAQEVLRMLVARGAIVRRFELATPTLEDIFIQVVQGRRREEALDHPRP